ncbi:MAG: sterol desaturase family protein [Chitinophagales bacterium]|nr:sterol desaturase family protein [Chitinophagales bacterium]
MQTYGKILLIAIPIFFIMILTEYIYGRFKGNDTMPIPDGISSLYSGLTNSLKDVLGLSIAIISYEMMVDKLAIFSLPNHVWTYVIAFVAIDFKGYWVHRLEHKINILWNRHIIHHSSEEFNLACALRQTISTFFELFFWLLLPAAIIGVPAQVIAILLPIHLFLQFWYHTRHIGKMGFLERIIVTPAHHRAEIRYLVMNVTNIT